MMVCILYISKSTYVSTQVYQCNAFVEISNSYLNYILNRYYNNPMMDKADCKTKSDNPDRVLKCHDVTLYQIITDRVSSYCVFYTRIDTFSFYSSGVFTYLYLYLLHVFCQVTLRFVVGLFLITDCLEL